jgi:hypothetical protein
MHSTDKYLPAAHAFQKAYPIGSKLDTRELNRFAQQHENGLAADLLIGDPKKVTSALLRHLNLGAGHPDLADQYRIEVTDKDYGRLSVISLVEHVNRNAKMAVYDSSSAAMRSLDRNLKAIERLNCDDLDAEMAAEIELRRKEVEATAATQRKASVTILTDLFVLRLVHQGRSEADARALINALPSLSRELKLLNRLRG